MKQRSKDTMPDTPLHEREIIRRLLQPFLEGRMLAWNGLAQLSVEAFDDALGEPTAIEDVNLGWYPAQRRTYPMQAPSGGLIVYARQNQVVLIEAIKPTLLSLPEGLEVPCVIKPHEILVEDAYVSEHVFCRRGLVLSIAEPFDKDKPTRIVRVRGFRPIADPTEFGPEYYIAFEDRIAW
jgi:hypothetical protein